MTQNDEIEIDLLKLLKALWKKAWAIVLAAFVLGGAMFAYGRYNYVPTYTTTATLYSSYLNTRDFVFADNGGNITQSSLSESRSLVNTCISVLNTRMTLEEIIDTADLDMTYDALSGMITAAAVNGTELFTVTVTGTDAEQVALIANTVIEVLPENVAMVNSNGFVGVIDHALVPSMPDSNNSVLKNSVVAAVLGAALVCMLVVGKELVADWNEAKKEKESN